MHRQTHSKSAYWLLLCSVLMVLQACSSKKDILYLQDLKDQQQIALTYQTPTIQPNDILKITVSSPVPEAALPYNRLTGGTVAQNNLQVMQLDGYLVAPEQTITFPVLGTVSTKGLTPSQLAANLEQRLTTGGHLTNPTVMVRLLNAKVTILGEVKQPGTYTFTEQNITLLQALGYAGDLTINGKRDDVVLIRNQAGTQQVTHIDLTHSAWLDGPYNTIKPNDVIVVNPNDSKVKSAGFVGNAGTVLTIVSLALSTTILLTR